MIKAVVFDLNGIFIQAPKLGTRLREDFKVPENEFLPMLHEIMHKVREPGAGRAFQYWQSVLRGWKINLSEQGFWDYWFGAEKISEKVVALAKDLKKKNIQVFILSNNFRERADYYGHYPWIHDAADKVYFSFNTGFIKPDRRAWELILSENNLAPGECIYFDDKEKNVLAAESVGIKSFLFTGEEDMEKIIAELVF